MSRTFCAAKRTGIHSAGIHVPFTNCFVCRWFCVVRYMIRNLRYTVTIDSVLANSKTQNAFLFTVIAIFRHDYPLAVESGRTPRPLVQNKLGEILDLLICFFLPCLSWLLRSGVRKSRRDLWITLYLLEQSHPIVYIRLMSFIVIWLIQQQKCSDIPLHLIQDKYFGHHQTIMQKYKK